MNTSSSWKARMKEKFSLLNIIWQKPCILQGSSLTIESKQSKGFRRSQLQRRTLDKLDDFEVPETNWSFWKKLRRPELPQGDAPQLPANWTLSSRFPDFCAVTNTEAEF